MYTGTVNRINSKDINTKFGPKKKFSMEIDGVWYDAGWKKPTVVENTVVAFDFKETTYGKELTSYSPSTASLSAPAAKASPAPSGGGSFRGMTFPVPPLDPSRSIIRQNALRHATATVSLRDGVEKGSIPDVAREIISVARMYEEYISGDLEVAAAKEELASSKKGSKKDEDA